MFLAALGFVVAAADAATLGAIGTMRSATAGYGRASGLDGPRRNRSTSFKPNGARECARRRRQIAAGILQVSP